MIDLFERTDERTEFEGFEVPAFNGEPNFGMSNVWGREDPETGEELITPFIAETKGKAANTVQGIHEQRSEKEQIADESFDAELTTDPEKWARNPDKYDYPGVDTVSPRIRRQRADRALEEAQERGFVETVSIGPDATKDPSKAGTFKKKNNELQLRESDTRGNVGTTLAHEVGHSVDFGVGSTDPDSNNPLSVANVVEDDEFDDELKEATKYVRGPYSNESGYRGRSKEKFADFAAAYITSPRRTKAEFPGLVEKVEERTDFFDSF